MGSIVVEHGLCCSAECEIFSDQGSNLSLVHWQADSLPLSHQGIIYIYTYIYIYIYIYTYIYILIHIFSSVQSLSRVRLFAAPWTAAQL